MDTMQEVERVAAERTRRDSNRPAENTRAPTKDISIENGVQESRKASQPQLLRAPRLPQPLEAGLA